jgi:PEP-CTERM motif-containing protein
MRIVRQLLTTLGMLALLCLTQQATNASTITFAPLQLPGSNYTSMGSYTELGFTFTNLNDNSNTALVSAQQGNSYSYAGSAGLVNAVDGGLTRLSQGGAGFSLKSIDLSRLFTSMPGTVTVTFTGNLVGGGTTVQTFTFSNFGFQTFNFNSTFTNLAFVEFGSQSYPYFQFDDVVVIASSTASPNPEPTTMLLLGTGLAGIAAKVLRRRRAGEG